MPLPLLESLPFELDQFTLLERLATGGMADVYLAIDRGAATPRWVAVKRIRADLASHPEFIDFFVTEGRLTLACHHPHLPTAFYLGRQGSAAGRPYLALEYIGGPTVLALSRAATRRRRPLAVPAVLAIGLAAARALDHLHNLRDLDGRSLDVIHRDVTPQNLLVAPGGVVKLIDMGVARTTFQAHRTEAGVIKGKYAYIAPEQLDKRVSIDQRADLFSLGAVMHELFTGQPLFHGASDLDTTERVKSGPIPHPSSMRAEIPTAIADVVMSALARDPDKRWPSAASMVDALERAAEGAGLFPWQGRLAREVTGLVGVPRQPALVDGGVVWREGTPPLAATDDLEDQITPVIEVRNEAGAWEVPGDPQLKYFLSAGAVEKPWQGSDSTKVGKA
ncbi:MAG TPA: serine/threonine-protein kinase [Kofleriaceae bacterium]|nr:serine/threonine-protein kinase [Kofleriaceae bacterium]